MLGEGILCVAVVTLLWVWDAKGLTVIESHSLIEIWAMRQDSNIRGDVSGVSFLLGELVFIVAVESNLWVWHGSGFAIGKGESLIEVWAMWQ